MPLPTRSLVRAFHEVRRGKPSLSFCPRASSCRSAAIAAESSSSIWGDEDEDHTTAHRGNTTSEAGAAATGTRSDESKRSPLTPAPSRGSPKARPGPTVTSGDDPTHVGGGGTVTAGAVSAPALIEDG